MEFLLAFALKAKIKELYTFIILQNDNLKYNFDILKDKFMNLKCLNH